MADTLKSFGIAYSSSASTWQAICTVPNTSGTYRTVLSISICNTHHTVNVTFDMALNKSGTRYFIYQDQSLPGGATFIHNDKIMMEQADIIQLLVPQGTADIEMVTSFLEQTA